MSAHEIMMGFAFLDGVLSPDATLMADAPGGVWRSLAPPSSASPYIIMAHQAGSDVTTTQGYRLIVDATYQVKCVGPASETAQIAAAAERIDLLLGGPPGFPASGAVTGGVVLACYRQAPLEVDELVNGELWTNVGGLYRLLIEQSQ